jgi:hypothetical protein
VGGAISGNRVQGSGTYGVLLQQSTATVGDNGLDGNASGDVHTVDNPIDEIGALPVPLP